MKKPVLTAIAVALLSVTSATAQTSAMKPKCDDASRKMANDSVMMMKDASKKDMAMKEMAMAKDMMMKKDEKGCMMHMEKAMGTMK